MAESLFSLFCKFVDSTIFPKENGGETVAFIVDQAFIDEFCKIYSTTEDTLLREVRNNIYRPLSYDHLHVKGILAIQLYAATKREDSGGITEKNYRDRLSQVLNWDIQDLQTWMSENQESYWERLYAWCSQHDFQISKCSRKVGAGRYVQYPVQQAARVFTQKDLKSIAYHFVAHKLQPGEDISENDFWRILGKKHLPSYVHTNHGKRLVEVPDYLQDAYLQVYNFYLRWDGSYVDINKGRSAVASQPQHFLFLSEDGHLDIRDKDMKLEKQIEWEDLTSNLISGYYTFKRSQWILFRRNEDYDGYWEETRYLEQSMNEHGMQHETGMAVVFSQGYSSYNYYSSNPFTNLIPIYSNAKIKVYRFSHATTFNSFYSEKKFFSLDGGLKVGRMQYLLGGAPVLTMERDSKFWIDGEAPQEKPVNGRYYLNNLKAGHHDIKFPGFRKIEFSIMPLELVNPTWDDSYAKWVFSRKGSQWGPKNCETGIVGIDYSMFKIDSKGIEGSSVITRWASFHLTQRQSPDEENIALRLLTK